MANFTLSGWKSTVATGVVESVPLQDFESALSIADDFLASEGGWNPDDPNDPTGPGVPVSGISTGDAIAEITSNQLNRIYNVDITGTMDFRIILNENLSLGLSDSDVLTNVTDRLNEVVEANLENTNIELTNISSFTGDITNGPTTSSERQEIQSLINSGGRLISPKAIGLVVARSAFNLDNTYNVEYLYTEPNKVLFMQIAKYNSTLYTTIDPTATEKFGISLDAITYRTTGGVTIPV